MTRETVKTILEQELPVVFNFISEYGHEMIDENWEDIAEAIKGFEVSRVNKGQALREVMINLIKISQCLNNQSNN